MFQVYDKRVKEDIKIDVYAVKTVYNSTIFLIYSRGEWKWVYSEDYEPCGADLKELINDLMQM